VTLAERVDVTIAIVNWNTRDLLKACLQSVAAGMGRLRAKIVVVDNSSNDGSGAMLAREFPSVEAICNQANLGYAHGNNQALAVAQGRYFLLLNPDTVVRSLSIEQMADFLDAHPDVTGATCKLLNLDGSFQRYYKRLPTWRYIAATHTFFRALFPDNRWAREFYMIDERFDLARPVEQPAAACLMLRRDRLPQEGLFDERFPIFFNDIDLCRQLKDQGETIWFLPEPEVVHHGSGGGVGSMKDQAIIDYLISWIRYVRKQDGPIASGLCWLGIVLNSALVLIGGAVHVLLGKKSSRWLVHESRRHWRLFWGLDTFQYPSSVVPVVPRWS
jgi:GT2 family glycosyltransferase